MPVRLCLEPRCPTPAAYRGRCQRHQRERNGDTHKNRHVYNSARWQNTRRKVLSLNPLCPCGAIAEDVHHKQSLEQGGDPWAMDNLEALCHPCHSRLTRAEQQGAKEWRPTP